MPHSIGGSGTVWYGEALKEPDGSYVTTEWFVVFAIPILPLGSKRVRFVHDQSGVLSGVSRLYTTQPVPLYIPHVIKGYSVTLGIVLLINLLPLLR